MSTAKVKGVFESSEQIRNNMLKKNLGKYTQWLQDLNPAIGEYYEIDNNRQLYDITDGKSLFDYTQDGESNYSTFINSQYFVDGREKEYYKYQTLTPEQIQPWTKDKQDYIQYIDEILGTDEVYQHVNYINDLLAGRFIENALRQSEVGVVRDISVNLAMQGNVTTNINNMSGKDTTLGLISNQMYARSLYYGSIFNSDRQNTDIVIDQVSYPKTYLTPYLVNQYGNNQQNVMELADILSLNEREIRIREDLGQNVTFNDFNYESNGGLNYLYKMVEEVLADGKQKYSPMDGEQYITYTVKDGYDISDNIVIDTSLFGYNDTPSGIIKARYDKVQGIATYAVYSEGDTSNGGNGLRDYNDTTEVAQMKEITNDNPQFEMFTSMNTDNSDKNSLIAKTNKMFNEHKIATMIGRFHTTLNDENGLTGEPEFTDTAKSDLYGNSHGRNLLKLDAKTKTPDADENGYVNPYCRTWTFHHQYNQMKDLIRPFVKEDENGNIRFFKMEEIQSMNDKYRSIYKNNENQIINGGKILAENTVLQDNGMVKITPTVEEMEGNKKYIKRCMFSIENLAWKDVVDNKVNLSKEQRGPNGGRVMWFPPYDLNFQENVNVDWGSNEFIGRGEKVYTYKNTDRTGTLNFTLLIDHPVIVNSTKNMKGKGEEGDLEADILRFFAGCDIFDEDNSTTDDTINIRRTWEETKDKTISFVIYFPNNFSGLRTDKTGKTEKGYVTFENYVETNGDTTNMEFNGYDASEGDDYWWKYLLVGNNTIIPDDEDNFNGYEMSNNGISATSIKNEQEVKNRFIPACGSERLKNVGVVFECGNIYEGCEITKSGDYFHYYKYHVDDDLHQVLDNASKIKDVDNEDHSGYYDGTCFQLNAKFQEENIDDDKYTFAEFIMGLMESKSPKNYDKYINFVTNCGVRVDAIEKLNEIFNSDKVTFKSIEVTGGADHHDNKNADMLSERRGRVVNNLLKKYLGDKAPDEMIIHKGEVLDGEYDKEREDSKNNKLGRYASFTIHYNDGEVKKYSEINGVKTEVTEEEPEGITFDEYYTTITSNSDILYEYSSNTNSTFKSDMKKRFNDDNKTLLDITNWTEVNNEIKDIINGDYCRDYLILSYSIADTVTSTEFTEKARTITSSCESAEGSADTMKLYNKYLELKTEYEGLKRDKDVYTEVKNNKIDEQEELIAKIDTTEEVIDEMDMSELTEIRKGITDLGDEIVDYDKKINEVDSKIEKGDYENKIKEAYTAYIESFGKSGSSSEPEYVKQAREKIKNDETKITEYQNDMKSKTEEMIEVLNTEEILSATQVVETITKELKTIVDNTSGVDEKTKQKNIRKKTKELKNAKKKYDKLYKKAWEKYEKLDEEYKDIYSKCDELYEDVEYQKSIIDAYEKRNDICLDDAKTFFFAIKDNVVNSYTSNGDFTYNNFPLRTTNKDDSGNDRATGADAPTLTLSFNDLFKHFLLIRYVEDNYSEYGDDYYLLFSTIDNGYIDECEELLWTMKENHYDCCVKESGCTESESEKYIQAEEELKNLFNEKIINKFKSEKQANEETERKENEKNGSQKVSETKESENKKSDRNGLNQIMKYGVDNTEGIENNRYENESEYFATLKENDPVVFKKLTDKFKYFDPAFHSMTPEGFNARLNFLHQCTRQGATYEKTSSSDDNSNGYITASNLAFGRMPVCVLRIGDFIHTRIVITSMSISYEADGGMQWDLNPEGIGVQPMFAKVSLNIVLLGGQSLEAPLNKLQNAISFNYYANSEVYDNRADSAMYDGTGDIKYRYIWTPLNEKDNEEDITYDGGVLDEVVVEYSNNKEQKTEEFDEKVTKDKDEVINKLDDIITELRETFKNGYQTSDINKTSIEKEDFANIVHDYSYKLDDTVGQMTISDDTYNIGENKTGVNDYNSVINALEGCGTPITDYFTLINSVYGNSGDATTIGITTIIDKEVAQKLYEEYKKEK